ncbi:MAG: hypothetical protein JOZ81_26890 [Chloroflexi bacterium]|nr:hypothetical protein [Chloroflexota bacterium]
MMMHGRIVPCLVSAGLAALGLLLAGIPGPSPVAAAGTWSTGKLSETRGGMAVVVGRLHAVLGGGYRGASERFAAVDI